MNEAITSVIRVPADHPSLDGHFPGQPVVPAVVLLDAVLGAIQTRGFTLRAILSAKFLHPVLPDQRLDLSVHFTAHEAQQLRASFQGSRATTLVFQGTFIVSMRSGT